MGRVGGDAEGGRKLVATVGGVLRTQGRPLDTARAVQNLQGNLWHLLPSVWRKQGKGTLGFLGCVGRPAALRLRVEWAPWCAAGLPQKHH